MTSVSVGRRVTIAYRLGDMRPCETRSISCCETSPSRHKLKYLSANLGYAAVRNSQTARSAERKVEDAAANPRSPVVDTNYYGLVARKISYANACPERQVAVGSGQ